MYQKVVTLTLISGRGVRNLKLKFADGDERAHQNMNKLMTVIDALALLCFLFTAWTHL